MVSVGRRFWSRLVRLCKPYFTSEARAVALGLLGLLALLLLATAGLNVVNSYVGRDFMTALEQRTGRVWFLALVYVGVFAASAAVGAFARYAEMLLGLRWRDWLTRRFLGKYLGGQAYYRLHAHTEIDNPDQRISEDIRSFTATALSFVVMLSNSVITGVAFAGVLWSITPWLFLAGVLYPALGTALIVFVGRRLVDLNNTQLKREADFRFELVHVREHAESIALAQAEPKTGTRLTGRLASLIENYHAIILVLRNLAFVTGGYNYLTQLMPILIVAPLYLRGEVAFGVVTQAMMAFSQIFNAFSLVAEKFQDLSAFAAVVRRLGSLEEAIAESADPARRPIQAAEVDNHVAYKGLTLRDAKSDRDLVHDLELDVPKGRRLLVTGPRGDCASALFRATAGLWDRGAGRIARPVPQRVLFLPERPYMVPGTLRDQLITAGQEPPDDGRIHEVLRRVGLEDVVERVGGLDQERDWHAVLSLGEQQLVAFARLLLTQPDFAFLDHATSALGEARQAELYHLLAQTPISYMSAGDRRPGLVATHEAVLELRPDGTWDASPVPASASG